MEVYSDGLWGTICSDYWDLREASVICRELGFGRAVAALSGASFGRGYGPRNEYFVQCRGNEKTVFECQHSGLGVHNCDHDEDAGAQCGECGCIVCIITQIMVNKKVDLYLIVHVD